MSAATVRAVPRRKQADICCWKRIASLSKMPGMTISRE
jgi:hypothetical protein